MMTTVVVVDLDPEDRELAAQLLRAAQYTVYLAADVAAFHSMLRISPVPLVAVVRLDAPALARALVALFPTDPTDPADPADRGELPSVPPAAAAAQRVSWAQRHAYILLAEAPQVRLVATVLVRLQHVFARYAPALHTVHDAVLLLTLVAEGARLLSYRVGSADAADGPSNSPTDPPEP